MKAAMRVSYTVQQKYSKSNTFLGEKTRFIQNRKLIPLQ